MDWTGCELVEVVEGKVSGVPLVKGTRIPPEVIVGDYELGSPLEEIEENYPGVSRATILRLISFAHEEDRQLPLEGVAKTWRMRYGAFLRTMRYSRSSTWNGTASGTGS